MGKTLTAEDVAVLKELPYLKISEAARLMRKSRKTIYEAIYAGTLECIQDGQRYWIKRSALDEWMDSGAPT